MLVRSWVVERESVKIELLKITSGLGETPDSRSLSLSSTRKTNQTKFYTGGGSSFLSLHWKEEEKGGREGGLDYYCFCFTPPFLYFISL